MDDLCPGPGDFAPSAPPLPDPTNRPQINDLTECLLCNEQYNESTRRARSLPCAHYFCNQCLSQVIKSSNPRCPSCRSDIAACSAEMLPPNFLMDELLSNIKSGFQSMSMRNEGADVDFSAGDCPRHKKCQLYFTCRSHKVKICRDCTVIEHNPSHCEIISFEDEMKETKETNTNNLETYKSKTEKNIKDLQDIITESEATIQKHQDEINKLQTEVNEKKQIVNKANAGIQDCKESKTKIEFVQRGLASSITIHQINQACKQAENVIKASNLLGKSIETNLNIPGFMDLTYQDPVVLVKKVLESNAIVYATAKVKGRNRYAQLMVKDGQVLLPALASCPSPSASYETVNVSSLLSRYTNPDIYMTLASGGRQLGTVYVKLLDNAAAHFRRKLCMATIGPCYRGIEFEHKGSDYFGSDHVGQYDEAGQYDGSCTEPYPDDPEVVSSKKGMVICLGKTGIGFDLAEGDESLAVGEVITGMSVVEEAYMYPEGQVSIADVGIVFDMNVKVLSNSIQT